MSVSVLERAGCPQPLSAGLKIWIKSEEISKLVEKLADQFAALQSELIYEYTMKPYKYFKTFLKIVVTVTPLTIFFSAVFCWFP